RAERPASPVLPVAVLPQRADAGRRLRHGRRGGVGEARGGLAPGGVQGGAAPLRDVRARRRAAAHLRRGRTGRRRVAPSDVAGAHRAEPGGAASARLTRLACVPQSGTVPAFASGEPPDFVVVGHVTVDELATGLRPGGSVLYAGLLAHHLGLRVGLVTSWGPDFPRE